MENTNSLQDGFLDQVQDDLNMNLHEYGQIT